MAITRGVIYVAYGRRAHNEATASASTLTNHHPSWPIAYVGGGDLPHGKRIEAPVSPPGRPGRWAKTNLYELSPFEWTLYLDADTRVCNKLDVGFRILEAGWEMVMVPSPQYNKPLHHVAEDERAATFWELGDSSPLMLNTGVIWFRRTERVAAFFAEWHRQWQRWQEHDQAAFLRALNRRPVALWLLGRAFNHGEVIKHFFGNAAQ